MLCEATTHASVILKKGLRIRRQATLDLAVQARPATDFHWTATRKRLSSFRRFWRNLVRKALRLAPNTGPIVIILVFLIGCWSPYCIYDLLDVYERVEFSNPQTKIAVSTLMQSLAPLNSVANPIISCIYLRREIMRGLHRISGTLHRRSKRTPPSQRDNRKTMTERPSGWTDAVAVPNNSRNSGLICDEVSSNGNALALYNHLNGRAAASVTNRGSSVPNGWNMV